MLFIKKVLPQKSYFAGNVGIGTTTPNTALQVNQSTTVPLLVHRPSNASFDPHGIGFSTRTDALNGGLGDVRSGIFSDYNGDLFLAAAQSSITTSPLSSSRLFIEGSNGNVGIGTISPGEKLQVQLGDIKIDGGANSNERGLIIAHGGLTGNQTRLVQDSSASIGHLYTTERGLRIQAGKDGSATGGNLDFYTNQVARYRITTGGGHQWTTDGSFGTAFSYTFRDAVGINNPNSVSAQAVAGYVLSVGRSSSGGVSGGIRSEGESHFVRGVSFGSSGQDQILNYYKEGTWTPTLKFGGGDTGITYAGAAGSVSRGGHYTKIGRVVTFSVRIILTSKGTSTGQATIVGLPFDVANLVANYGSAMYSFANNFAIPERAAITMDSGNSIIRLRFTNSSGAYGDVTNSDFNNNSDIILTGTYQAGTGSPP